MAFNAAPNTWLANWAEDGTEITVPIATFPQLTAAEADGATGDIRKVLFAILEKLKAEWEARAAADRPDKLTLLTNQQLNAGTGQITRTYTVTIVTDIGTPEVAAEE